MPLRWCSPAVMREAALVRPVAVVLRVLEALLDGDVHAADRIDHRDEAGHVHRRVVVDRDAKEGARGVLERPQAAIREDLGVAVGVGHQRVELRPEHVAVAQRDVDHVARHRHHRDAPADRVERSDHHRVGQGRRCACRCVSTPTIRTLIRSPSRGSGRAGRSGRRPVPRVPGSRRSRANVSPRSRPYWKTIRWGTTMAMTMTAIPMIPEAPGRAGPAGVEERLDRPPAGARWRAAGSASGPCRGPTA